MDRYRTGRYAADNPDWHDAHAPHKAAELRALLDQASWSPRVLVDVGCGTGGVLAHLVRPDQRGVGIDVSPDAIARAPAATNLVFRVGDVGDAPPGDLALCLDVVEHVPDDLGLLRDLRRVSHRVAVRIPLDASAWDTLRPARMLRAREQYGHLRAYTLDLARALVTEAGITVVAEALVRVPEPAETRLGSVTLTARRLGHRVAPETTARLLGGFSWLILGQFTGSR